MCGIAGVLTASAATDTSDLCREMAAGIRHRGPDDHGVFCDPALGLGLVHQRLSIQDLSPAGAQPMASATARYTIVFNGEIYNFHELKAELPEPEGGYRGHSDTEILLQAIETWGLEQTLPRLNGMFALALWDSVSETLDIARDRLGEKPLYWSARDGQFSFASEMRALMAAQTPCPLSETGLSAYLRYGYVPAPHSMFAGVYKLLPGHRLSLDYNRFRRCEPAAREALVHESITPWWQLQDVVPDSPSIDKESDALSAVEQCLQQNVARQCLADVDVGLFLSSGIDSSLVAALAQEQREQPMTAFTVSFGQREFDETDAAADIAKHLGMRHEVLPVGASDNLAVVDRLADIYDEPFADSSQIPTFIMTREARSHVKVCLSGDGGDELFAGYNRYHWGAKTWRMLSRIPLPLRRLVCSALQVLPPRYWDDFLSPILGAKLGRQGGIALKLQKLLTVLPQTSDEAVYDSLLSYWQRGQLMPDIEAGLAQAPNSLSRFEERGMFWDQGLYLPGDNLTKVDRASMANGMEVRLPLLNVELLELSWQLSWDLKFRDGKSKWLLRQCLYKRVPAALIDRPKMGFSVPVRDWLRADLRDWAEDLMADDTLWQLLPIDPRQPRQLWQSHLQGHEDGSHRLWTILMLLLWLRNYRHWIQR